MRVAIIYSSKTGNTKMVAEAVKKQLEQEAIIYFGEPSEELPEADIYFMGSWTDKGSTSAEMTAALKEMQNKKIAYFGTAGFGGSEEYYAQIFGRIKEEINPSNVMTEPFFCQGKMPVQVKMRYEKMLEENPENDRWKASIENFNQALSHPDNADLQNAKDWAARCIDENM